MRWYLQAFRNYANFSGRARRKEYWMFYLFNMLVLLLPHVLTLPLIVLVSYAQSGGGTEIIAILILCLQLLTGLYGLAVLIPGLAVVVRRLHDQDKSGAWIFITFVPFIGGIWFLALMCMEGTRGPNRYGEDPKGEGNRFGNGYEGKRDREIISYSALLEKREKDVASEIDNESAGNAQTKLDDNKPKRGPKVFLIVMAVVVLAIAAAVALPNYVLGRTQVDGMTLSARTVGKDENISAQVTVVNTGLLAAKGRLEALVDYCAVPEIEFVVNGNSTQIVEIPLSGFNYGKHRVDLNGFSAEFTVLKVFVLSGLKVESEDSVTGMPTLVRAMVENRSDTQRVYHAVFTVDDAALATQDVTIPPNSSVEVKAEVVVPSAGSHTLALDTERLYLKTYDPNIVTITGLKLSQTKASLKENVNAEIAIQNKGELSGKYVVDLYVNGEKAISQEIDYLANSEKTVILSVPHSAPGEYVVKAGDFTQTMTVYVSPAVMKVAEMVISNEYPKANETVVATTTVTNVGDVPGSYRAQLLIDGKISQSKTVTLAAYESIKLSFRISDLKKGSYIIGIGNLKKKLYVGLVSRPANGTFYVKKAYGGLNFCTFFNSTDKDTIFFLAYAANPKATVLSVYVRAKSEVDFPLKDGKYIAYALVGDHFVVDTKRFINVVFCGRDPSAKKFESSESVLLGLMSIDHFIFEEGAMYSDFEPISVKLLPR